MVASMELSTQCCANATSVWYTRAVEMGRATMTSHVAGSKRAKAAVARILCMKPVTVARYATRATVLAAKTAKAMLAWTTVVISLSTARAARRLVTVLHDTRQQSRH